MDLTGINNPPHRTARQPLTDRSPRRIVAPLASWLHRNEALSAATILAFILSAGFYPFLFGRYTLLGGARGVPSITPNGAFYGGSRGPAFKRANDMDAATWFAEPYAALVGDQYLREKRLPLWNPYQAYGTPLAANMQSQVFYPLSVLYALAPGPRTFNLFVLLRLLLTGLFAYFYLRLFFGFVASLAGGIACMLSGYYVLYLNMPDISVNLLLPALFYTAERLVRNAGIVSLLGGTAVAFLCVTGGMPESTFLAVGFAGAYFLFRVLTHPQSLRERLRATRYFLLANILGAALSAFLLFPFMEFMARSFNTHQPEHLNGRIVGLIHDTLGFSLFTYLVPLLFGPVSKPLAAGLGGMHYLRGFVGVVPFLFAAIAAATLMRRSRNAAPAERWLVIFFSVSAVVILMKRYGSPLVNWIGHLPLFRYIVFLKYDEPLLSFAFAVLCAYGVHVVLTGKQTRKFLLGPALFVLGILITAVALSFAPVSASKADASLYYFSLAEALAALFLATAAGLAAKRPAWRNWAAAALVTVLAADLIANYIAPVYYVLTTSASSDTNPYRGAPFLDFLESRTRAHERIFARNDILHPDWASPFRVSDIRSVDALYDGKYQSFIHYFLRDEIVKSGQSDLQMVFTGSPPWSRYDTRLKTRLLQLSSARFLLSAETYAPAAPAREADPSGHGITGASPFQLVYDREIRIYEYLEVLPRASLFSRVETAAQDGAALSRLADPSLDIFGTAVLSPGTLQPGDLAMFRAVNQSPAAKVSAAKIVSYSSQQVDIETSLNQPALLMLNDLDYPGWKVYVDAVPSHTVTADYLFRGVFLKPGMHKVRFTYQPASFAMGATTSGTALIVLVGSVLWPLRRKHFARTAAPL